MLGGGSLPASLGGRGAGHMEGGGAHGGSDVRQAPPPVGPQCTEALGNRLVAEGPRKDPGTGRGGVGGWVGSHSPGARSATTAAD